MFFEQLRPSPLAFPLSFILFLSRVYQFPEIDVCAIYAYVLLHLFIPYSIIFVVWLFYTTLRDLPTMYAYVVHLF